MKAMKSKMIQSSLPRRTWAWLIRGADKGVQLDGKDSFLAAGPLGVTLNSKTVAIRLRMRDTKGKSSLSQKDATVLMLQGDPSYRAIRLTSLRHQNWQL